MSMGRVSRLGGDEVSHLSSVSRFIRHTIARRAGRGSQAMDRPRLVAEGLRITPARLRRYLASTGGEPLDPSSLPPTLPAIWETALAMDLLRLAGFGFPSAGVLHAGTERIVLRHPSPFESFDLHLSLSDRQRTRTGTRVRLEGELRNRLGQPCQVTWTELVIRGLDPLDPAESPRGSEGDGGHSRGSVEAAESFEEVARWRVPAGAGRLYARASGDFNPIHLWGVTAKAFGFGGPILQGASLEAMVAHRLIGGRLEGEVGRLRRLAIRFVAPLVLPAEVVLEIGALDTRIRGDGGGGSFSVLRRGAGGEARVVAVGSYVA